MYDPRTGRFLQLDPIYGNRAIEHYVYASNNCISQYDPMGLKWEISDGHLFWTDAQGQRDYGQLYKGWSLTRSQYLGVRAKLNKLISDADPKGVAWTGDSDITASIAMLCHYYAPDAIYRKYRIDLLFNQYETIKGKGDASLITTDDVDRLSSWYESALTKWPTQFSREHPAGMKFIELGSKGASYAAISAGQAAKMGGQLSGNSASTADSSASGVVKSAQARQLPFKKGDIIYRKFNTPAGEVEMLAEIDIDGGTLHLKDIAVYGTGSASLAGKVGVRGVFRIRNQLAKEASELGFDELRISGTRVEGSSSANPGHKPDVRMKLDKGNANE
jgi:hypothetical protein